MSNDDELYNDLYNTKIIILQMLKGDIEDELKGEEND